MGNSFDDFDNDKYQDYSNFGNDYNNEEDYDFIDDYESIMQDIEDDTIRIPPEEVEVTNFYDMVDNWDEWEEQSEIEKQARKGKRSYTKFKEDENEYKKEFAEELTMLYDLLDEVSKFSKKLDKKFDALDGSKAKGTSKYLNDLIASIITSKTTKLQILKEIASVKKTIADLKQKSDGRKERSQQDDGSLESVGNSYFRSIMGVGRNAFVEAMQYDDGVGTTMDASTTDSDRDYADALPDNHKDLQERISSRLQEEGFTKRKEDGDKYIMYENMNVEIKIKFNLNDNTWEPVAVDGNGNEVNGYPLPTKKELGKVKFNSDNKYCTDGFGRPYKVIEVGGYI